MSIKRRCSFQLAENLRFFDNFPVLLVPRKLETAQNRKVWAARAKPVLPTNFIFCFIDSLKRASKGGALFFAVFDMLLILSVQPAHKPRFIVTVEAGLFVKTERAFQL